MPCKMMILRDEWLVLFGLFTKCCRGLVMESGWLLQGEGPCLSHFDKAGNHTLTQKSRIRCFC